jgi:hypothetical protein
MIYTPNVKQTLSADDTKDTEVPEAAPTQTLYNFASLKDFNPADALAAAAPSDSMYFFNNGESTSLTSSGSDEIFLNRSPDPVAKPEPIVTPEMIEEDILPTELPVAISEYVVSKNIVSATNVTDQLSTKIAEIFNKFQTIVSQLDPILVESNFQQTSFVYEDSSISTAKHVANLQHIYNDLHTLDQYIESIQYRIAL